MRPFLLSPAATPQTTSRQVASDPGASAYLAGGTTVVDLLKLDVVRPDRLVDLAPLREHHGTIAVEGDRLRVGALATMADLAADPVVVTGLPVVAEALLQAASPQIRNMATIGGNLLQRTRCPYFRDAASPCNRREPGTGCGADGGDSRGLAVLGTSPACIASYPGDLAVALVALDAEIETQLPSGGRQRRPVEGLHRLPEDRPDLETVLEPGELILGIDVPLVPWSASTYHKVRDRSSYAFALASAAVALRLDGDGSVNDVRLALGGLAARPWRCRTAEAALRGRALTDATAWEAAALALEGAKADTQRSFKIDLGRRTVVRALLTAAGRAAAPATKSPDLTS